MSAPYRPGQSPWPGNQPQRPDRPPPVQYHEEPPTRRLSALDWALRGLGLVAVAVISGFLWWFLTNGEPAEPNTGYPGPTSTTPRSTGQFDFELKLDPVQDDSCADNAYGRTKTFLTETPCERLTRGIYATTVEGRTIYTAVMVVRMPDEDDAKDLRELTDTNNTGNVKDLVRDGQYTIEGLDALSGGAYASTQHDREVVIVESDYDPADDDGGSAEELETVCDDALRLGADLVADAG